MNSYALRHQNLNLACLPIPPYPHEFPHFLHGVKHKYNDKSSKKIVEYLTKFYCDKTANELIVPTNKIYRLFKEKYEFTKNIHIIPTGIEVERFFEENVDKALVQTLYKKLGFDKKDFIIISVGRLASENNVEFLLKAHQKILYKLFHMDQ